MAPGLKQLFKRQAEALKPEDEEVVDDEEETTTTTTLATHIFGKHLHKVRVTTATTTLETEGEMKDL